MLLTCPACDTQYKVDEASLAPEGSRVRCFRCSYTWTAKPEGESEKPGPAVAAGTAGAEKTEGAKQAEGEKQAEGSKQAEGAKQAEGEKQAEGAKQAEQAPLSQGAAKPQTPRAAKPEPRTEPASAPASDDGLREKLRHVPADDGQERPLWPYYLLILVLAITLAAVIWTNRETLATAHPLVARAYSFFGYDAALAGEGLKLESIRSVRRQVGGARELRIEGEVVNVSAEARSLPALRIRLLDPEGSQLDSWTETLGEESLQPGDRALFSFTRADPPEAAADIGIEFVPRSGAGD